MKRMILTSLLLLAFALAGLACGSTPATVKTDDSITGESTETEGTEKKTLQKHQGDRMERAEDDDDDDGE